MIPHFFQCTEDTCGAACMKMVLASFGIHKTERELVKIMRVTAASGTSNAQIPRTAEFFHLSYVVQRNAKVSDIVYLQKQKYRVIVSYIDPVENIGHFAVVKKVGKKSIDLLDPWHGAHHELPIRVFKQNWKSMFEPDVGLLIGIRK